MNYKILLENVRYDHLTGELFYKKNDRLMKPDEDGFVFYSQAKPEKLLIKVKANKLCCLLGFGKPVRQDQRVLHRNLNESDCRLRNLLVVPRKVYLQINEARLNLESRLRLVPHEQDQHSYWLIQRKEGMDRRELIHDIVIAQRRLLNAQLKYAKILSKYCVFDEDSSVSQFT